MGPASVKSINGNSYAATRIDEATRQTKLYFQKKKSEDYDSYIKDEAYIENQSGNHIKICRFNRGEFSLVNHQGRNKNARCTPHLLKMASLKEQ
jgi:hypothetical protein